MTSRGTSILGRSARKSVTHLGMYATAAVADAAVARFQLAWNASSLTEASRAVPVLKKMSRNVFIHAGVSAFAAATNPSNTLRGTPSGLSSVWSRKGAIGDTSTPRATRDEP